MESGTGDKPAPVYIPVIVRKVRKLESFFGLRAKLRVAVGYNARATD